MPDTAQTIALKDGRTLGFAEFGEPSGKPVMYFHGHPGAGIEWPALGDDGAATELGLRIIAVDRPGHGLSSFQPGRRIADWSSDVVELADQLGVEQFGVLGLSGGGPYALACAHGIPGRLTGTAVVSGMGPAEAPGATEGMSWTYPGKGRLLRKLLMKLSEIGLRKQPERFMAQTAAAFHGPDKDLLDEDSQVQSGIATAFSEAFRDGVRGPHYEAGLYSRPWGFELQEVRGEIHLWHGEQDENVLPSVARYVAEALPICRASFLEHEGHITIARRRARDYLSIFLA